MNSNTASKLCGGNSFRKRSHPYEQYFNLKTTTSVRLMDQKLLNFRSDFLCLGEQLNVSSILRTQHRARVLRAYAKALRQVNIRRRSFQSRRLQSPATNAGSAHDSPEASPQILNSMSGYLHRPMPVGPDQVSQETLKRLSIRPLGTGAIE